MLGLVFSSFIYTPGYAEEIIGNHGNDDCPNKGVFIGYHKDSNEYYTDFKYVNDNEADYVIRGFGIYMNAPKVAEDATNADIDVNGGLLIDLQTRHTTSSLEYAKGAVTIDNVNNKEEGHISLSAQGITIQLTEDSKVQDKRLADYSGVYLNGNGEKSVSFTADAKGKDFIIDGFQNGVLATTNASVNINNTENIFIQNNSYTVLRSVPSWGTTEGQPNDIKLNAKNNISFYNNQNGIYSSQNSGLISLKAGNSINFINDEISSSSYSYGIGVENNNLPANEELGSSVSLTAKNIHFKNFIHGIWNISGRKVILTADYVQMENVREGIHIESESSKDANVEVKNADKAGEDAYISISASEKAINAQGTKGQVSLESYTNQLIGGTEAVYSYKNAEVSIAGTNNIIGNSLSSDTTTYNEEQETYALPAKNGGTISVTAEQGGVNQITSDGFRTIYAEGQGWYGSDISISGAVQIQNKNYLSTDDNVSKIAVVASGEYSFSTGKVTIDLDETTGNFIGGSVIAGQNGVVSINEISNTTRANEKAGSIAVLGNVFAGNNGQMTLNLGDGGYLQGRVDDYQEADSKQGIDFYNPEFSKEVTSKGTVHLTMGQGAKWDVTGQSWVTNLDGNGGVVNMTGTDSGTHAVHVGTLEGNHTFVLDLDRDDHAISDMLYIADTGASSSVQTVQFNNIAGWENMEDGEKLRFATVNASESELSFVSGNSTGVAYLRDRGMNDMAFSIDNEQVNYTDETKQEENESYNGTEFSAAKPGNELIEDNYNTPDSLQWFLTKESSKDEISDASKTVVAMSRINYSNAIYMDRLNKRMGEARYIDGDEGLWVRMRHDRIGKSDAFRSMNTMMELGYDTRVNDREDGEHRQGVAIDYMRGTADYKNVAGEGDVRRGGIWFYDTWLGDKGHYTDYVLKFGRLSNDFELYTRTLGEKVTGDYSNFVYSASAEYGRKKDLGNNWYIEPQAQIQYAHVTDADYTTSQDTHVQLDAIDSLIGRVGFRLGKDVGEKSTFYIKADVLHEFLGDQDIEARDATGLLSTTYENEGTWYDIGLGFSHQFSKGTYMYLDMEKSIGNDNEDTYQFNFGMNWKV